MKIETLTWTIEGFNHRAQGKRRVYWINAEPLGTNRFRPAIQRGAVTFYCDCSFDYLDDAKAFCQSDHDSIQEICDEHESTLRTQLKSVEAERDEARWLLKHAGDPTWSLNYEQSKDWFKRRDAFLNPTNKDVM